SRRRPARPTRSRPRPPLLSWRRPRWRWLVARARRSVSAPEAARGRARRPAASARDTAAWTEWGAAPAAAAAAGAAARVGAAGPAGAGPAGPAWPGRWG